MGRIEQSGVLQEHPLHKLRYIGTTIMKLGTMVLQYELNNLEKNGTTLIFYKKRCGDLGLKVS